MRDVLKANSSYLELSMRMLDVGALILAGHIAAALRFHSSVAEVAPIHAVMLYFCGSLAFLLFPQFDLYVSWRGRSLVALGFRLAMSWSLVLLIGLVFSFLIHHVGDLSRLWMVYWYLVGIALLLSCRTCVYLLLRRLRMQGLNNRRVLIVGYNQTGREMHDRASQQNWYGYDVMGIYVSDGEDQLVPTDSSVAHVQHLDDVAEYVVANDIDELWITLPMAAAAELRALHFLLRNVLTDVRWIPNTLAMRVLSLQMVDFLGFPALDLNAPVSRGGSAVFKAMFDKLFSAIVLVLLSPLLLAIAIGVKLSSPGPVLFMQSRLGLNGRKFEVYKFRTMTVHREQVGVTQACQGDARITRFGAFLRQRSLDELPQFFNVLLGDMSVVGPRPPKFLNSFENCQAGRHDGSARWRAATGTTMGHCMQKSAKPVRRLVVPDVSLWKYRARSLLSLSTLTQCGDAMSTRISRLIGRLTVGRKLALIYFLDLTTVIFISAILINEKFIAIDFTKKEIVGNAFIAEVRDALLTLVEQDAAVRTASGRHGVSSVQPGPARSIETAQDRHGADMGSAALSHDFAAALAQPESPADTKTVASRRLSIGQQLLTRIGNQSNLILDPDLDSYYTMSLLVLRFPALLEVLDSMHRLSWQMAAMPDADLQAQRTQFLILEGRFDAILAGIDSDYREAYQASSPLLKASLMPSQIALAATMQQFRIDCQRLAGMPAQNAGAPVQGLPALGQAVAQGSAPMPLGSLRAAWSATQMQMARLLQARNDEAFHRMWLHLGTALLLMALILTLVFLVARQIAIPIRQLAGVTERVRRSGDYSLRAGWESSDEIGRLVTGFNDMLQQLDAQRIGQQDLIAQASAAQAQRAMIEAIPIPLMVTSVPDHRVLHANEAARGWLGGHDRNPWQHGMDPALRARFFQTLSDTGGVDEFEVGWTAGSSAPSWALVSARQLEYQGQQAILATFTPMNRLKQMESGLALWAKVFEASSESIVVMDGNGRVLTVNQAFRRGTAFEMHEVIGKTPDGLLAKRNPPELMETVRQTTMVRGSWQGEIWFNRKNGEPYPAWLVMNAVRDVSGAVTHFIAMSLDITERKASEQRIHYLAHHDSLTGLPNRFSCDERMALSLQQARRRGSRVAVLFVDLDRFKNINDSLGHHIGDELLCSVATRLSAAVREGDTVSRLGGDEFVVVLDNIVNVEEIGKVIEHRLIPAVRQSHRIDGDDLYISCSIGAAVFPDDGENVEDLMRHADSAMYQAKKLGRNHAQFFTPELNARVTRHLHLESDLRHAVERNELVLHYQPRIDARSGRIAGVESLVRWQHPIEGLISPVQFIPLAEESGLIVEIGAWIIAQACRQHQLWRQEGVGPMPISINLSALQIKDDGLVPVLIEAIAAADVPAAQIELELTESLLMENVAATIQVLNRIKALGFSLSIDDFGTGYSSLNYLYRFPIDKLKIDRSFIQNIHAAPDNLAVTKAIIGLGHTLGLEVVAEGVEQAADVDVLQAAGCDELQGYYFARPMPAAQFAAWLASHRASVA